MTKEQELLVSILLRLEEKCCFVEDKEIYHMICKLVLIINGDEKHEPRISNGSDTEEAV